MTAGKAGNKPVHLRRARNNLWGREAIWASIRSRKTFTILDIEHDTRIKEETIRTYVTGLQRAGYLELTRRPKVKGKYPPGTWRLINDIGVEPPQVTKSGKHVTQGTGREQMWRTMKMLTDFDKHDLAIHASTEAHPVSVNEALFYLQYLHRAGYLAITRPSKPGTSARYRLLASKNTGPRAPMIQRVRQVFDPNTGEVVYQPAGGAS